jgi:hypothetical protein
LYIRLSANKVQNAAYTWNSSETLNGSIEEQLLGLLALDFLKET